MANYNRNRKNFNQNSNKQQNNNAQNANEQKIIIAERDNIAAVLEGNKVTDFFIHRGDILLGDVYLATVDNILPSIDAAFVNVGSDKMGFLHAQDVMGKGSLKEKLSPKQKLIVQVVKEPTGHKGPRVTTEISLPGRFLVLMPYEPGISISKKIENSKERARLKSIVSLIKPVGVGVIIRTEAEGLSEADIQEDLEVLLEKWNNIITSAETLDPPNLLCRDQDLLYRVIREACTEHTKEIVVDTAFALNRVQNILQNWHMAKNVNVTLYKGTDPLLVAYDIHKEIKAALNIKVNMPSGGYLFIQQTEALTVIDVNSGKFISSATQDETILKTNLEAVHEIARQLRLRNIGGMIIIDFIDMLSRADKLAIMEELEIALEADKAKPQVGQLSDLGLVELTRHRQGQSLSEIFTKRCPHCQGSGYFMNEFNFATPTAEGEYRAKQAKIKMPINNVNNKKTSKEQQEPQNQIETETVEVIEENPVQIQVENPSAVASKENEKRDRRRNNNKKSKFNKQRNDETKKEETTSVESNEAPQPVVEQVSEPENIATEPVTEQVVETVQEEVKPKKLPRKAKKNSKKAAEKAEETQVSEPAPAPVQPNAEPEVEVVTEEKPKKTKRTRTSKKTTDTESETAPEEAPKKTKRPNRGASRKAKSAKKEETVEE
ncbi:Rne/Rng family ribonuclease [bacterium]|nr:Rne/Rng family ribonuclease [bacterium]